MTTIADCLKLALVQEPESETVNLFIFSEDGGASVDLGPLEIKALIEQLNQCIQ